jgi:hypothetical protein
MNRKRAVLLGLLLAMLPVVTAQAEEVPFTAIAPEGWSWWCGNSMCVLLPDESQLGYQQRFLLVTRGDGVDGMLPGWLGGGEVVWEGVVRTFAGECRGRIATDGETRGFIGTSDAWTVAAIGPARDWEGIAHVYNFVLRGGEA